MALASSSPAAPREIDHAEVRAAARELLRVLGTDIDSESLSETPRRMADARVELLTPKRARSSWP